MFYLHDTPSSPRHPGWDHRPAKYAGLPSDTEFFLPKRYEAREGAQTQVSKSVIRRQYYFISRARQANNGASPINHARPAIIVESLTVRHFAAPARQDYRSRPRRIFHQPADTNPLFYKPEGDKSAISSCHILRFLDGPLE